VAVASTPHECPSPGCARQVPFEKLACPRHWRDIPSRLQLALLREFSRRFGEVSYFAARADCLRALGVAESEIPAINAGVVTPARAQAGAL
jgi:hypothetical protein